MSNTKPTVTISLLTWNGEQYLPWLLKSLAAQTYSNWELLVLDNASNDRSVDIVREHQPKARIVKQKNNIGFSRANNLIINWSDSDYVFVLNQDIILDKDYIAKLVEFMENNKSAASCAGKMMYWDFASGEKTKTIDSFGLKIDRRREVVNAYQGKKDFDLDNQEVFGLSATATIYRRKALDSIAQEADGKHLEYFDEDFFAYKEDIDLAWRLRLFGWQHWLITNTKSYHHRSISGSKNLRESRRNRGLANKLSYRNHLMTLYKNSFHKNLMKDFWPVRWYELKKFIYLLLFERSTLAGLGEYFSSMSKLRKKRKFIMKYRKIEAADMYKWFEK